MSLYRIACVFEPNHPRMSGKSGGSACVKRGVWRVIGCWPISSGGEIYVRGWSLYMSSTKPARIGALCNPRRILERYQTDRRVCGAVKRVSDYYGVSP